MKVYLLEECSDCEVDEVLGVFTSEQKAKDCVILQEPGEYKITELELDKLK